MDTSAWISIVIAVAASGGGAWLGARWWFGRQAAALRAQLDRAEKARQATTQQSQQMRKQIEKLQKDMSALHASRPSAAPAAAAAPKDKAQRLADAEALLAAAGAEGGASAGARAAPPEHGFAETQPMSRL
jgi:hypothetical protein